MADHTDSGDQGAAPTSYGESFADVYDDWYGELSDPNLMVAALLDFYPEGARLLEVGAGTGRLSFPLVDAGFEVTALDASTPMLAALHTKAVKPEQRLAVAADMAAVPLASASHDIALIAWNTFFNLDTEADQRRCLVDLARVLTPDGWLIIEAFTPATPDGEPIVRHDVAPARISDERAVMIATRVDERTSRVTGVHLDFGAHGLRVRPWHIRYVTPQGLDDMAAAAGLALEKRWTDWDDHQWTPDASRHISIYRLDS